MVSSSEIDPILEEIGNSQVRRDSARRWVTRFEASDNRVTLARRSIPVRPSPCSLLRNSTYAFVDASLEIEVLMFTVGLRVLVLQSLDANGASVQSLLEAHACRLALHADLSGNLTLFHD